jgi:hypothetical protein
MLSAWSVHHSWARPVWLIYDLLYRALSHPKILPTVGNAGLEDASRPFFKDDLYPDYGVLLSQRSDGARLADIAPLDPARRKHANNLAMIAMEFFILHELAHITYGHCEYSNRPAMPFLMEFRRKKETRESHLVDQYFEIFADSIAAMSSWARRLQVTSASERLARSLLEQGQTFISN